MYSAFIIRFATDVLAQGQQQKPKKCIQGCFFMINKPVKLGEKARHDPNIDL